MIPQYKPLIDREDLAKEVNEYILGDGMFTEYKHTEKFEAELGKLLDVPYCTVVNNGTVSLSLALLAMGIKAGDKVVVPNITMIATCNAVKLIGAIPVFCDIDPTNLCLDLGKAGCFVSFQTVQAVIYVTLNGRSHSRQVINDFSCHCQSHGVAFIQDNAQSLGSEDDELVPMSAPNYGIGSFSFSMPKIITTGQGGCLVTHDKKLALKIKKLKDFGRETGGIDIHDDFGINSKFTEIQAIMGLNQLKSIHSRILAKSLIYNCYKYHLRNVDEVNFIETDTTYTTPWFVDIYVNDRDMLKEYLQASGIGTRAIYPELTSQKVNHKWYIPKHLKNSYCAARTGLWLPSSMDLKPTQIVHICDVIKEFYGK